MASSDRVVIIGAGVFGLSLAYQLASEGNHNVTVMDRHVPPVWFFLFVLLDSEH